MRKVVIRSRDLFIGVNYLKSGLSEKQTNVQIVRKIVQIFVCFSDRILLHYHYRAHGMQQPIFETNLEVSFQWFLSTEFGELVPESCE